MTNDYKKNERNLKCTGPHPIGIYCGFCLPKDFSPCDPYKKCERLEVGPPPIHEHYNPDTDQAELCGRVVCPYGYVGVKNGPKLTPPEPDYHQRFRERFDIKKVGKLDYNDLLTDILAFIDEVVAAREEWWTERMLRETERIGDVTEKATRAALREKVEGMRENCILGGCPLEVAYNRALDDILTHLRGSEPFRVSELGEQLMQYAESKNPDLKSPTRKERHNCLKERCLNTTCDGRSKLDFQEETGCCWKCYNYVDYDDRCFHPDCPCHKPRTEAPKESNKADVPCPCYCHVVSGTGRACIACPDEYCSPITSEEKEVRKCAHSPSIDCVYCRP